MSSLAVTTFTLATAVANNGTVAINYPTGSNAQALAGSVGGKLVLDDGRLGSLNQAAGGFSAAFGATTITITNLSGYTWPAGTVVTVSFDDMPRLGSYNLTTGGARGQAQAPTLRSFELTASGAVPAGTELIELNHPSVIVAATYTVVPNSVLYIKNTSASGTAAHRVTLTGGTFNGTNTIATLDARDEFLAVLFDSAGRGQVIANVGAVALS
jgi:hypothetical protein